MKIEYATATIKDFDVTTTDIKDGRVKQKPVTSVTVDGENYRPTDRFWNSLYGRYGLSKSTFNYFTHREVFTRVAEQAPTDRVRICVERPEKGRPRLLGVSNPSHSIVRHDELMELVGTHQGHKVTYANGVVESYHTPARGKTNFQVAGDAFANQFVFQSPIDGWGKPSIYLSLLREICSNGMVGFGSAFRTQIETGKNGDPSFTIARALEGFGNDEGYAALRERFESAADSWASVKEAQSLYNLTARLIGGGFLGSDGSSQDFSMEKSREKLTNASGVLADFHRMTGDISALYGATNIDMFSAKKQRVLPVKCKVYDLINFATELATHHAKPEGSRRLQAWTGTVLTSEYDLEGTAGVNEDFQDFFVQDSETRRALDSRRN